MLNHLRIWLSLWITVQRVKSVLHPHLQVSMGHLTEALLWRFEMMTCIFVMPQQIISHLYAGKIQLMAGVVQESLQIETKTQNPTTFTD